MEASYHSHRPLGPEATPSVPTIILSYNDPLLGWVRGSETTRPNTQQVLSKLGVVNCWEPCACPGSGRQDYGPRTPQSWVRDPQEW